MSLLDIYKRNFGGNWNQPEKPKSYLPKGDVPTKGLPGGPGLATGARERGFPERIDISNIKGADQKADDLGVPLQAMEALGKGPGFIYERPIVTVAAATGLNADTSKVPILGEALGFASDVITNISNLPAAIANQDFARVLRENAGKPDSTIVEWQDWGIIGALAVPGGGTSGLHHKMTLGEMKEEAQKRGFSPEDIRDLQVGPIRKQMTLGEMMKEARQKGFTAEDVRDLQAGRKGDFDFGDKQTSDSLLIDITGRLGTDPLNLLIGTGMVSKAVTGVGMLSRLERVGVASTKVLPASMAAEVIGKGSAVGTSFKGLGTFLGNSAKWYTRGAIGLTVGEYGLLAAGEITGLDNDEPRGGFMQDLFDLNRAALDYHPFSDNTAFSLLSAVHFPYMGGVRAVKGKVVEVKRAALGTSIRNDVVAALGEHIPDAARRRAGVIDAIGGPKEFDDLLYHVISRLAFKEIKKNPTMKAAFDVPIDSIDEALVKNKALGDLVALTVEEGLSKGRWSSREIVDELKGWYQHKSGAGENAVFPWDSEHAIQTWTNYAAANKSVASALQARQDAVLGLSGTMASERITTFRVYFKDIATDGFVPAQAVRRFLSEHSTILDGNYGTGQQAAWLSRILTDDAPVSVKALDQRLRTLEKKYPNSKELFHEVAAAEKAVPDPAVVPNPNQVAAQWNNGGTSAVSASRWQASKLGENLTVEEAMSARNMAEVNVAEANLLPVLEEAGFEVDAVAQAIGAWKGKLEPGLEIIANNEDLSGLRRIAALVGKKFDQDTTIVSVSGDEMRRLNVKPNGVELTYILPTTDRVRLNAVNRILGDRFPGYTISDSTGLVRVALKSEDIPEGFETIIKEIDDELTALWPKDLIGDNGLRQHVSQAYIEYITKNKGGDHTYGDLLKGAARDGRVSVFRSRESALEVSSASMAERRARHTGFLRSASDGTGTVGARSFSPSEAVGGPGLVTAEMAQKAVNDPYIYRAVTEQELIGNIVDNGLTPEGPIKPRPDGSNNKRVEFTDAPEVGKINIRMRREGRIFNSKDGSTRYSNARISPSRLEVLGADGLWHAVDTWDRPVLGSAYPGLEPQHAIAAAQIDRIAATRLSPALKNEIRKASPKGVSNEMLDAQVSLVEATAHGLGMHPDDFMAMHLRVEGVSGLRVNAEGTVVHSGGELTGAQPQRVTPPAGFITAAPDDFHAAITAAAAVRKSNGRLVGETVYVYPREEYAGMRTYLSEDGLTGFAIKPDGDLVSVFNVGRKGAINDIIEELPAMGARKLDAFDESGRLPELYARAGFKEYRRDAWNPEYAPEGWQGGTPDVVYMKLEDAGQGVLKLNSRQGFNRGVDFVPADRAPKDILVHYGKGEPGMSYDPKNVNSRDVVAIYRNEAGEPVGYIRMDSGDAKTPRGWDAADARPIEPGDVDRIHVFVKPAYRRQGIATAMYDWAQEQGWNIRRASGSIVTEQGAGFTDSYWAGRDAARADVVFGQAAPVAIERPHTVAEIAAIIDEPPPQVLVDAGMADFAPVEFVNVPGAPPIGIPGGLAGLDDVNSKFSIWDMWKLRAQAYDPKLLPMDLRGKLYAKMFRTQVRSLETDPMEVANRMIFAQLSPLTQLGQNEAMYALSRVRNMDEVAAVVQIVDDISTDYKPRQKVDYETGKPLYNANGTPKMTDLAGDIGAALQKHFGYADVPGIKTITSGTQLGYVGIFLKRFQENPQWFLKGADEPYLEYVERIGAVTPGASVKVSNFGVMLGDPVSAKIGTMDSHMAELLEVGTSNPDPLKVQYRAVRKGQLADYTSAVPEHLKNLPWEPWGNQISLYGGDYKLANEKLRGLMNAEPEIMKTLGSDLGGYQWYLWDGKRATLEPHVLIYPGAYALPKTPPKQLKAAIDELRGAGFLNRTSGPDRPFRPSKGFFAQSGQRNLRGATRIQESAQAFVAIGRQADATTLPHELWHVRIGLATPEEQGILQRVFGDDFQELGAQAFEKYLSTGKAPTAELQPVFQRFKAWILDLYRSVRGTPLEARLNPEVKALYDRWLTPHLSDDASLSARAAADYAMSMKSTGFSSRDAETQLLARLREVTDGDVLRPGFEAEAQEVNLAIEILRSSRDDLVEGQVSWAARRDAEVAAEIPIPKYDGTLENRGPEWEAAMAEFETRLRDYFPSYTLKAPPRMSLFYKEGQGSVVAKALGERTALGDVMARTEGLWGWFDWLISPAKNSDMRRAAHQALMDQIIPHGATAKEARAFTERLETLAAESKISRRSDKRWFNSPTALPHPQIEQAAKEIFKPKTVEAIMANGGFTKLVDRSYNRFIRHVEAKGAEANTIEKALEMGYSKYQDTFVGDVTRIVSKTLYPVFRFYMDPRWWAMNMLEADILGALRYGRRATRFERLGGRAKRDLSNASFAHQTGGDLTKKIVEGATDDTGWLYTRNQAGFIGAAFDVERPQTTLAALKSLGDNDPVLLRLRDRFGTAEDDIVKGIDDMLYSFDQNGTKSTIYDQARQILGDDVVQTPGMAGFLQKMWERNDETYQSIVAVFRGNPNRTNIERIMNSYWLFWPLSYQVKAGKWLFDFMLNRMGGKQTNALGAATYAQILDFHRDQLSTNPEYAQFFEDHPEMMFAAQMFVPITPGDMGVSLSRLPRYVGGELGLWGKYKAAQDPISAATALLNLGPFYTLNLLAEVRDELDLRAPWDEENEASDQLIRDPSVAPVTL